MLQRSVTRAGNGGRRWGFLVAMVAAVASCSEPVATDVMVSGQWEAGKDPAQTIFTEATAFSFSLAQTDTVVEGTWGATGPSGVVVRPDQLLAGRVRGTTVELTLRYNRYEHGCTGASRDCYDLLYRLLGTITAGGAVEGRVVGPPNPAMSDADLPTLARWTLRRR